LVNTKENLEAPGVEIKHDFRSIPGFHFKLTSNNDGTQAFLTIDDFPLKFDVAQIAAKFKEEISKTLTFGLIEDFFRNELPTILSRRIPTKCKLIAQGSPAIPGKDSRIEFLVPRPSKEFLIRKDGTCDFKNRDLFRSVSEREIILIRHPPVPGIAGKTVFGTIINPPKIKNTIVYPGKNVIQEKVEDKEIFRAACSGQVVYNFGFSSINVQVSPILKINGNIDFNTGNINFKGSVEILGSILSGFSVIATGNVTIMGMVEQNSKLTAGGDIYIRKGILGSHAPDEKTEVKAFGNLQALYAENAVLTAEGDIFLRSAVNCSISTNQNLFIEKNIIGGETVAFKSVQAGTIGNDLEIKTIVRTGISHTTLTRLNLIVKILDDLKNQLVKTEQNLSFLKDKGETLLPQKRQSLLGTRIEKS